MVREMRSGKWGGGGCGDEKYDDEKCAGAKCRVGKCGAYYNIRIIMILLFYGVNKLRCR